MQFSMFSMCYVIHSSYVGVELFPALVTIVAG